MAFNAENTLIFMNWLVDNKIQLEHGVTFWGNTWDLFMESDVAKSKTQQFVETMITKAVENPVRKNAKAKKIDPVTGEPVVSEKKPRASKKVVATEEPVIDPVTGEPVVVEKKVKKAATKKTSKVEVSEQVVPVTTTEESVVHVTVAEKKKRAPKKATVDPVTGEPVSVEKKPRAKKTKDVTAPVIAEAGSSGYH